MNRNKILKFQNLSKHKQVIHAITTRHFDSDNNFNLADYAGTNTESAIRNRQRLCEYLKIDFNRLTIAQQTHDNNATIVTEANLGTGKFATELAIQNTDALITVLPNTPLMMFSADCPLVIIYDFNNRILALMHCSWRSISKGLIENTIFTMKKIFNSKPLNLAIGIGPGAGKCCYQVDKKFIEIISTSKKELIEHILHISPDKMTFDLHGAIIRLLLNTGISESQIEIMNICTICDKRFFSYRRESINAGRFALIASLIT